MTASASDGQPTTDVAAQCLDAVPDATATVLRELASSIALVPHAPLPAGVEQPLDAVTVPVIERQGQRFIVVFTSEDAMRAAGVSLNSAARVPLARLGARWPSDDIWLAVNPVADEGVGLPPEVVRMLPMFAGSPTSPMAGPACQPTPTRTSSAQCRLHGHGDRAGTCGDGAAGHQHAGRPGDAPAHRALGHQRRPR